MNLKPTLLNIPAVLFLIGCLIYTAVNYSTLSYAGGWGIVAMGGVLVIGMTALVVDLAIHNVIKSPKMQLVLRCMALIAYGIYFYFGLQA